MLLEAYRKGDIELISGSKREYVFSNIFEVASNAPPWDRVAVGRNLEYVQECVRAEGVSPWYTSAHDEFALCMDGEVLVEYVKLDEPRALVPEDKNGAVQVGGEPQGRRMGSIRLRWGHQALLNKDCAYRFSAPGKPGVLGADANRRLAGYARKIGPDPASIDSAKIGGIAANNSSGMCCGTSDNSYKTLASMENSQKLVATVRG